MLYHDHAKEIIVMKMQIKRKLENRIYEMEKTAKIFNIASFSLYFLGGSACILGEYNRRATRSFNFVDLNYPPELGKVFIHLRDYDMLDFESTVLSPGYKERAVKLSLFKYLDIFVLSVEDIIVSKIIRMAEKDFEDIDQLIKVADAKLINKIINEVLNRQDLYEPKKTGFLKNLPLFRKRYNV